MTKGKPHFNLISNYVQINIWEMGVKYSLLGQNKHSNHQSTYLFLWQQVYNRSYNYNSKIINEKFS